MSDTKVIESPTNGPKCPQCGTPLPTGALAGLCPACLLKGGLATATGSANAETIPAGSAPAATVRRQPVPGANFTTA
jgi:hypothetical protein